MKGEAIILISVVSLINGAAVSGPDTNDPRQAAAICAWDHTNSILVAHEHCNKFYKCDHGKPVEYTCAGDLQFDTKTGQCDWPYTVECGNRIVVEQTTEDCVQEEENDNGGNTVPDIPDHIDTPTGNCDPSQAPSICAAEGSSGILVAHENCNMFYKCDQGLPVAFECPHNLLYNTDTEECDWAENVVCGNRVISDPNCDENEQSKEDDQHNDNNESGNGSGNCDPSEAPLICAASDSDGILVAHENCNKFYICGHGTPIPHKCPGNLLFNPAKNYCDWPENVDCGVRVIPQPDTEDNVSGENENNPGEINPPLGEGGNDESNDNNGNGPGCGCNFNPAEAPAICAEGGSEGTLVAHENCNQFYICNGGRPVVMNCPASLLYNPSTEECDWPHNVDCGDRIIPVPDDNGNDEDGNNPGDISPPVGEGGNDENNDNNGNGPGCGCNFNPAEAPAICAEGGSEGTLVAHENCNQFYICNGGRPVVMNCPASLLYNPSTEECDWPHNVDCGDRIISVPDDDGNDEGGNNPEDNPGGNPGDISPPVGEGGNDGNNDNNGNGPGCGCNFNPAEAPAICAEGGSEGTLVAHENCNQFYICNGGRPVVMDCPASLLYNPSTEECDWPHNVDCGDRIIPVPDDNGNDEGGNNPEDNPGGNPGDISPPVGEEGNDGSNDNNGNGPGCGCNFNPAEAPAICAEGGSEGTLVAHENCNQFYICNGGRPVVMDCPASLLYNPSTEECDWPHNVDCGDRIIPVPDDNGNDEDGNNPGDNSPPVGEGGNDGNNDNNGNGPGCGCNFNPAEAPAICAEGGSEGTLVAHENCNQFYICNGGRPVVMNCPASLLYNPSTEECDWPHNVDCGDRIISVPDDDGNDEGGNNPEDNPGGNPGDISPPVGEGGNDGNNDNNGNGPGCGCNFNPAEAPAICAEGGSEGTLVAHENCNQFYICNGGRPVVMNCPASLLYNPSTEECDWPHNVDCGDRIIPVPDDNGNDEDGNNPGDISPPVGEGGNDGNNDNNGNGPGCGCNFNPAEAPAICAEGGSEGTLVAHENCNQFYICNGGRPVVMNCPASLLYNPSTEECDWPHNVDCGDRIIPVPDDNGNDEGGNNPEDNPGGNPGDISPPVGEEGNDGSNDNNGNGPGCGCNFNPAEAPAICAEGGSEGTLVAHENCNQFYICNGGKPVVMDCPASLLYNPSTEECDWPHNVDCGDRIIPVPDDNGNDEDGNNPGDISPPVGEGGNDGNNDNNGNGPGCGCNFNPAEAPAICAEGGSEGTLVAHENCNQFYICNGGRPVVITCPASLLYNPSTEECDWPHNVDCGDRIIPVPDDNGNGEGGNNPGDSPGDNQGNNPGDSPPEGEEGNNGGNDNNGNECNDNPAEAPSICAKGGSEGTLVAHENCNQFYVCNGGRPVAMNCPASLLYNPSTEKCDWPHNIDCGDRIIPVPDDNGNDEDGNNPGDISPPIGEGGNDGSNDNNGNGPGCGCNNNPAEAPAICAAGGSEGTLVAHENCNQFYICNGGRPVVINCPASLLYNPSTEECDWHHNVDCGDRIISVPDDNENGEGGNNPGDSPGDNQGDNPGDSPPEGEGSNNGGNDNNGNECNDNPAEAPAICAADGSEGTFVAHENCNQFSVCNGGRPVAMNCPASLLYNPLTEQCDWAHNVNCGNRIVPDPNCEENDNDDAGNDNPQQDNDDLDNGVGGSCNDNPAEAPAICAANNSEGVMVAHENCNQFYICNGGWPVALDCPADLLYSPVIERCDWAENVNCGNRTIPENCNQDENEIQASNENNQSDVDEEVIEIDDPLAQDAQNVCTLLGSDGKYLPHKNCNQFYVCIGGIANVLTCPATLYYEVSSRSCLWPQDVNCGNRIK